MAPLRKSLQVRVMVIMRTWLYETEHTKVKGIFKMHHKFYFNALMIVLFEEWHLFQAIHV